MSSPNDKFTNEEDTRFTLRLNTEILNKVKAEAIKNKRSTAKEIEYILEYYFNNAHVVVKRA